ncbi:MAG: hypothetical protein IJP03_02830, partial [Christensenellaceae bacterium]|nr:hypothetical protein [Christensenellaceae bacterium]
DYNGKEAYVIDDYAEKLTLAGGYTYENLVLSDLQQQAYKALAGNDITLDGKSSVKIVKIKSFKNGKQRWNTATSRSYVTADATLVVQYLPAGSSELSEKTTVKVSIDLMIKSGSDYQLSHPYLDSNLRLRGVEETEGGYNVTNRRYGHGVGMSQRGAQTMAKSYGMTYKEILAFYYDGTYLESLYTAADKATLKSSKYTIGKKTVTGVNPSSSTKGFLKNFTVSDGTIAVYTAAGKQKTDGDVGTGDMLYLKDSAGDVQAKYTVIIYGDVNGDSEITLVDLLRIQKHLLGTQSITGASATAADVSRDGEITLVDLLRVQKHLLGTSSISQKEG